MSAQISPLTEAILQGFKLGVPPEQISEDLSNLYKRTITPEYVLDVGMRAGILGRGHQPPWYNQLPKYAEQGLSAGEIAKIVGKNPATIRVAAARRKITLAFHQSKVDIIRDRFIAGERPCDIAESMHIHKAQVSKSISPIKDKQTGKVKAEFQGMTAAQIKRKIHKRYQVN